MTDAPIDKPRLDRPSTVRGTLAARGRTGAGRRPFCRPRRLRRHWWHIPVDIPHIEV
jgi:hypothetical protein